MHGPDGSRQAPIAMSPLRKSKLTAAMVWAKLGPLFPLHTYTFKEAVIQKNSSFRGTKDAAPWSQVPGTRRGIASVTRKVTTCRVTTLVTAWFPAYPLTPYLLEFFIPSASRIGLQQKFCAPRAIFKERKKKNLRKRAASTGLQQVNSSLRANKATNGMG